MFCKFPHSGTNFCAVIHLPYSIYLSPIHRLFPLGYLQTEQWCILLPPNYHWFWPKLLQQPFSAGLEKKMWNWNSNRNCSAQKLIVNETVYKEINYCGQISLHLFSLHEESMWLCNTQSFMILIQNSIREAADHKIHKNLSWNSFRIFIGLE